MILYLFIKDRVEPCFPYLCNSYNLARMVIPVICNEIIIKRLIFCEHFNALKDLPGQPLQVQETQEMALQRVQFQKHPGGHALGPH